MKRLPKLTIVIFILVVALTFGLLFIFNSYFSVKHINVIGEGTLKGLAIFQNKNILFLSKEDTEKTLYIANPHIKRVRIEKKYPDELVIVTEKAEERAVLIVANGFYVLSTEGRVLEKRRDDKSGVPHINLYQKMPFQSFQVGDMLDNSDIVLSLFFIDKLSLLGIKTNTVDINGIDMILLKSGEEEYIFSSKKDKNEQYDDLKLILERFKIDNKTFKKIDVRFDKPIVTV